MTTYYKDNRGIYCCCRDGKMLVATDILVHPDGVPRLWVDMGSLIDWDNIPLTEVSKLEILLVLGVEYTL